MRVAPPSQFLRLPFGVLALVATAAACARSGDEAAAPHSSPSASPTTTPKDAGTCKREELAFAPAVQVASPPYAIEFDKNADVPTARSMPGLDVTASLEMLGSARPTVLHFAVVGHADADETSPMELSERRANAVMRGLVQRGIAADRMEAHGFGTRPIGNVPHNRLVVFKTMTEAYHGRVVRWADGGLEPCPNVDEAHMPPGCGLLPEQKPRCLEW